MAPTKKRVRSKIGKPFEPVQLNRQNRLPPKGLGTCEPPLRRSARLGEKIINRKFDYSSISQRQSLKKAKIRENRRQGQLPLKSKSPQTKKAKKSLGTKRKSQNQPQPFPISKRVRSDYKQPRTRDTQEIIQGVNQNKGNLIKNWLSTVPLSLENLVDPMAQKASENVSSNPVPSLGLGPGQAWNFPPSAGTVNTPSAVRAPDFRELLGNYNIFINIKNPPTELVNRAKQMITKELSSKMDDSLAQELAVKVANLESEDETKIAMELGKALIPSEDKDPQSVERTANKLWSNAAVISPPPDTLEILSALPKPKPDMVFGYSPKAFVRSQLLVSGLLKEQGIQNYARPDRRVMFPFLVIEFKAQATGGTHFIATNQVALAGAVAMEGTLQLARRISAENQIDFDEAQFFSMSIDNIMAYINVHWLSRDAENGAFCFHMKTLQRYILDADGLKAVNRAITNILNYGVNKRLARIRGELDIYRDIINKGNLASDLLPKEQQQQQQRRSQKRKNEKPSRQAPQTKRPRQAKGDTAYGEEGGEEEKEDDEEGASSAAELLQISRKNINSTSKDSGLNLRRKAAENLRAKNLRAKNLRAKNLRAKKDEPAPETGGGLSRLNAVKVPGMSVQ